MERNGLAIAIYTRVFNPGSEGKTVYRHTHMALFTPVSQVGAGFNPQEQCNVCSVDNISVSETCVIPEHLRTVYEDGCTFLHEKSVEQT